MAWTNPRTWSAAEALTAALMNEQVSQNMLMGGPVFTNEAARDAAITAPVEGMRCMLTASTVTAAAGGGTTVPGVVETVYNGSGWVCVSPVCAINTSSGTRNSSSYGTLTGLTGTAPSVTLTTGTAALVTVSMVASNATGGAINLVSPTVTSSPTVAATDPWAAWLVSSVTDSTSATVVMTGLTAGTNTFELHFRATAGTVTATVLNLIVQGIA